jgi:hypothetical protein
MRAALLALLLLPLLASPASALVTVAFDPMEATREAADMAGDDATWAVGTTGQTAGRAQEIAGTLGPGGLVGSANQTGLDLAQGGVRTAGDALLGGVQFGADLARALVDAGSGLPNLVVHVP